MSILDRKLLEAIEQWHSKGNKVVKIDFESSGNITVFCYDMIAHEGQYIKKAEDIENLNIVRSYEDYLKSELERIKSHEVY